MQAWKTRALFFTLTGALFFDHATAGTISVAWDPVEADLLSGYRIEIGEVSGVYDDSVEIGLESSATLGGFADCQTHYLVVKALGADGRESPPSEEVAGWPRPRIRSFLPRFHQRNSRSVIELKGANFAPGAQVFFDDPAIHVHSITVAACDRIFLDVSVGAGATPGPANVWVVSTDRIVSLPKSIEIAQDNSLLPEPLQVNFESQGFATPEGYASDTGQPFDAARGWGWDAPLNQRYRPNGADPTLATFVFTNQERSWLAEVANGDYDVRVVAGDYAFPQGPHRLLIQGTPAVSPVVTPAGSFLDGTLPVEVRNGLLEVTLGGNVSGVSLLNRLVMTERTDNPDRPVSISFGPDAESAPPGYVLDRGETYDPARGFGWASVVPVVARQQALPQVRDTFALISGYALWELAIENGFYQVSLSVGDGVEPQGPHRVVVEGTELVAAEPTLPGEFIERSGAVRVTDGGLSLLAGGPTGTTALNQIVVARAPADIDADGRDNELDNCPFVLNPAQLDLDGDGAGHECDDCPFDALNDADVDGVCGDVDNCPILWNPGQEDPDADGLGSRCDACPSDAANDADLDGRCANADNCPLVPNPSQTDTDGDGSGDACDSCPRDARNDEDADGVCGDVDTCPSVANPMQTDTDRDGRGNKCDACPLDPRDDADGDGLCANVDNCPLVANVAQTNLDGDDLGDACDACPADPTNDQDGDGRCGSADNCPATPNPSQSNLDGDGLGDACDACPLDAQNDQDADGVCGDVDNCPAVPNPLQTDSDGDGKGNKCDVCPFGAADDTDADGLCSEVDNCPYAWNPYQSDVDGDGLGDRCDAAPYQPGG